MKEKIRKFMDEPLTIRRELKINLIALGIFAIPYAILVIYANYKRIRLSMNLMRSSIQEKTR